MQHTHTTQSFLQWARTGKDFKRQTKLKSFWKRENEVYSQRRPRKVRPAVKQSEKPGRQCVARRVTDTFLPANLSLLYMWPRRWGRVECVEIGIGIASRMVSHDKVKSASLYPWTTQLTIGSTVSEKRRTLCSDTSTSQYYLQTLCGGG